ncbi:Pkinase-domain-containing protein, partial [Aureobasidium melanogenum]
MKARRLVKVPGLTVSKTQSSSSFGAWSSCKHLERIDSSGTLDELVFEKSLGSRSCVGILVQAKGNKVSKLPAPGAAFEPRSLFLGNQEQDLHRMDLAVRRFAVGEFHGERGADEGQTLRLDLDRRTLAALISLWILPVLCRSKHEPPPRYSMTIHSLTPRTKLALYRVTCSLEHVLKRAISCWISWISSSLPSRSICRGNGQRVRRPGRRSSSMVHCYGSCAAAGLDGWGVAADKEKMSLTVEGGACMRRAFVSNCMPEKQRELSASRIAALVRRWPPRRQPCQPPRCPDNLGCATAARHNYLCRMCRALNLIAREPPPCSDCILTALLVHQSDYKSCSQAPFSMTIPTNHGTTTIAKRPMTILLSPHPLFALVHRYRAVLAQSQTSPVTCRHEPANHITRYRPNRRTISCSDSSLLTESPSSLASPSDSGSHCSKSAPILPDVVEAIYTSRPESQALLDSLDETSR